MFKLLILIIFVGIVNSRPSLTYVRPCSKDINNGTFLILAPKSFRPGEPFRAIVNVFKDLGPLDATLSIEKIRRNVKKKLVAKTTVTVADQPVTATILNIPKNIDGSLSYELVAKLTSKRHGTILFEGRTNISIHEPTVPVPTIFVQTDKAIYKPGDTVRFRVIVVDSELKPFKGKVSVGIKDYARNLISYDKEKGLTKGVYSNDLQLSTDPPLGKWTIDVEAIDEVGNIVRAKETKAFDVEKYVLPKFSVQIDVPKWALIGKDVVIKINSMYTYCKGVRGNATVTLSPRYRRYRGWWGRRLRKRSNKWGFESEEEHFYKEAVKLDASGSAEIVVPYKEFLDAGHEYHAKIDASVTEELTGIEMKAESKTIQFDSKLVLIHVDGASWFKPGLDYSILVRCTDWESNPVLHDGQKIYVVVTYEYGSSANKSTEKSSYNLDENATKRIVLNVPKDTTYIGVKVHYGSESSERCNNLRVHSRAPSPSNSFMQVTQVGSNAKLWVGEIAEFIVKTSDDVGFDKVIVLIYARDNIVMSKEVMLRKAETTVRLLTTNEMVPTARVVVYGIRAENKEIVADAVYFHLKGRSKQKVSITINKDTVEPFDLNGVQSEVEVRVKSERDSFVGVLGVDQSVRLLKTGNDITSDMVQTAMPASGHQHSTPKDADSLMNDNDMVAITDAYVHREFCELSENDKKYWRRIQKYGRPVRRRHMSARSKGSQSRSTPSLKVRSLFPETWLWLDAISTDGEYVYKTRVPDTITSWLVSAFAVNDESGLGVAEDVAKLTVFRDFFMQMNLPYSIKQGEKVALPVMIFNYGNDSQLVTLTLEQMKDSGFKILKKSNSKFDLESDNVREVTIPGGESKTVSFPITPTTNGNIKILVKAIGSTSNDAVERNIIVEPEGFRVHFNEPVMIDMTSGDDFETTVNMAPPPEVEVVPGSQQSMVSVIGDLLGPSLSNLENLVRMPYGCGEQNMVNFVPNIVSRRYLEATGGWGKHAVLIEKTTKYMMAGYQRELNYKRNDGSYSAFGESDSVGSTWLTAFVVGSFADAAQYITIDPKLVRESVRFLEKLQTRGGKFREAGKVSHTELQGASHNSDLTLTAYVLIALLKQNQTNRAGVKYLEDAIRKNGPTHYELAISTYALHLANSAWKNRAFNKLKQIAKHQYGLLHWKEPVSRSEPKSKSWWYRQPKSADIEMTSYAALTYLLRGDISGVFPVIRWLMKQRNSLGGFASTQDTVMGLSALGRYAEETYPNDISMRIVTEQHSTVSPLKITKHNAMVLQTITLEGLQDPVKIKASGRGTALVQVSWDYNVYKLSDEKPFKCTTRVLQAHNQSDVTVFLCCKYGYKGKSNMVVMEVEPPSGYEIDEEKLKTLTSKKDLKRVETSNGDTKAAIYLNTLGRTRRCVDIRSNKVHKVAEQKPSSIKVYDYYDPIKTVGFRKQVQLEYSLKDKMTFEEICPDCWDNLPADDEKSDHLINVKDIFEKMIQYFTDLLANL